MVCALDISKIFDKKLPQKTYVQTQVNLHFNFLLGLLESLSDRFQRALLNGQTSEWLPVKVGVPQGSIPGLFFS